MAYSAYEADALSRPTLDQTIITTVFQPGSAVDNVQRNLESTINERVSEEPAYFQLLTRHTAARVLRVVLSCWRKLPAVMEEYEGGYLVDKFDYGYTAMQSLKDKWSDTASLDYQIVTCLTREFKNHNELTAQVLQEIVDAASKTYLQLMERIHAAESGDKRKATDELGPELEAAAATYSAVLDQSPTPKPTSRAKCKAVSEDFEPVTTEATVQQDPGPSQTPKKRRKPNNAGTQITLDSFLTESLAASPVTTAPKKKGPGNFNHRRAVPWHSNEHYFAEQCVRQDPLIDWDVLLDKVNDRFKQRRTKEAVRQRFSKFKQSMKDRQGKNLLTQGTESDVEPAEDSDIEDEGGAAQGDEKNAQSGKGGGDTEEARFAQPNTPESNEDPAGDLEELVRRGEADSGDELDDQEA